jgi:hypothetical protein
MADEPKEKKEEKTTVTIRGLDKKLYREIMSLAKQAGKTVGEAINEAMELLISLGEGVVATGEKFREGIESTFLTQINGIEELTLSEEDLSEVKGQLLIRNINKLVFKDDVEQGTFDRKIRRLININELHIPKTLSKIKVLSRSSKVKKIIEY